jgi:hypothetical protein
MMSDLSAAAQLSLPDGPVGATLRAFIEGRAERNGALMKGYYSEDVVLNGKLYQEKGADAVIDLYTRFIDDYLVSFRAEALTQIGHSQWLILEVVVLKGSGNKEMPITHLLTMNAAGEICRIENCYDMSKVPLVVLDALSCRHAGESTGVTTN